MAEVTVSEKIEGWSGGIKTLVVKCTSPSTGDTYDTDMDAAHGRESEFKEIFSADFSAVADNDQCAFNASTGVVTLPTISNTPSTGYITIRGR